MAKRIYFYGAKDLEGLKWIAKVVDFGVGLTIRATTNEMLNTYLYLRERKDIFRQKVKMLCNSAMEEVKHKETEIKSNMKDKRFWDDYCDKVVDSSENDILMLRISVKQELDNVGCKDSDLLSRVETVRIMLDMCTKQYEEAMKQARHKYGRNFSKEFNEYYMKSVLLCWDRVCDMLYRGVSVDLNTPRVKVAFDAMCKKFADGSYIDECLTEAKKTNPGFENTIIVKEC